MVIATNSYYTGSTTCSTTYSDYYRAYLHYVDTGFDMLPDRYSGSSKSDKPKINSFQDELQEEVDEWLKEFK